MQFSTTKPTYLAGQVLESGVIDSYLYAAQQRVGTLTVGGTPADGDYVSTFSGIEGQDPIVIMTTRATTPSTNTDLATQHVVDIEANAVLRNVLRATSAAAVVTLTWIRAGETCTVTTSAPSGATLTWAETTAAAVANLPVGIAVAYGATAGTIRALATGDTDASIAGVVARHEGKMVGNTGVTADVDGYEAGSEVPVLKSGVIAVPVEEAVVENGTVRARMIAAATEQAGRFRTTHDGTAQVTTGTPTAANDTEYVLQIHFTAGPAKGETFTIQCVSDSSATATEICTALKASLNADTRLAALITESGTDTLILTATDDESIFQVTDIGAGAWASITTGTAGAPDTITMANAAYRVGAANGGTAALRLNRS